MVRLKAVASAAVLLVALGGSAQADCPSGVTYTNGVDHPVGPGVVIGLPFGIGQINGSVPQDTFDSGPKTSGDCHTAGSISVGTGSAVSGVIVTNPNDATEGLYIPPVTAVYGQGSSAIGHGAFVGRVETYTDDKGDADPSNDTQETRLVPVNNGTALGAGARVEHEGSTAVGAGAKTAKENEVVLGTEKTTVRAPSIPQTTVAATGLVTHDAEGNLGTDGGEAFRAITAHTALLSDHTARLDEHAKGLAIAMAMPDAWLSDKKSFGIFGAVGGFEGETALGFAAIGRLDETWSLNAKVGADTEFDHIGWQVGVGAQW